MTATELIQELLLIEKNNPDKINLDHTIVKISREMLSLEDQDITIGFKGYFDDYKNNKFEIIIKPLENK
jgi:hypothetical protein